MMKGEPGGYYIPDVDAEGNLTWTPSEEELAAVESSNIRGPQGLKGETGVYVGEAEPTDEDALVWINPAGAASESLATKAYVDEQIAGLEVDVDLSDYYDKKEVDAKLETIELTPGPQGEPGEKGEPGTIGPQGEPGPAPVKGVDYFTEEDIAEITAACSNVYYLNYVSGGTISAEDIAQLEEIYARLQAGDKNFTVYVGLYLALSIELYAGLSFYISSVTEGTKLLIVPITDGKVATTTYRALTTKGLVGTAVNIVSSSAPSGTNSTAMAEFQYIKDNYYTKTEVEALIQANLPASGDEVSY